MFKIFNKKNQNNDEKPLITRARSKSDGIVFFSNEIPIAIDSFIENDEIHIYVIPSVLDAMFEYCEIDLKDDDIEKKSKLFRRTLIFDIIFIILISLFFKSFHATYATLYFSIFISFDLVWLINNFYNFNIHHGFIPKSVARFHGAEHKAINAYCKLKRVPTFEEVKKASRFSNHCGSNRILMKLASLSVAFLTLFFNSFGTVYSLFFWSLTIFLIILWILGKNIIFLQFLVTAKPTDLELKCALKGIQELDRINSEIKKNHKIKSGQTITIDSEGTIDEFFKYLSKKFDIDLNETSKEANTGE